MTPSDRLPRRRVLRARRARHRVAGVQTPAWPGNRDDRDHQPPHAARRRARSDHDGRAGRSLGLQPASPAERPAKLTAGDEWALNLRAARQFHDREGHLRPSRKHIERLDVDGQPVDIKLGLFLDNTRRRADKLTAERRADLDHLHMRW